MIPTASASPPERLSQRPACSAQVYREGKVRQDVLLDDIDVVLREPGVLVWLDVEEPTEGDFEMLAREFNLHPLAIEDLRKGFQRPKLDQYDDSLLIVLFDAQVTPQNKRLYFNEVDIFVGPNYLITVHDEPVPAIKSLRERWGERPNIIDHNPLGFLLYHLIDELVDNYFPVADALANRIEEMEERVFGGRDRGVLRQLFALRRNLILFRRVLGPERDLLNLILRHEEPLVDRATRPYFADVLDLLMRLTDTVDSMRDLAGAALEAYLSIQSNQLNEVLKRMTAMTVTLMVPTLIAGVYGMNFTRMPELEWTFGYPFALGLMVIGAAIAVAYFWRKGWF